MLGWLKRLAGANGNAAPAQLTNATLARRYLALARSGALRARPSTGSGRLLSRYDAAVTTADNRRHWPLTHHSGEGSKAFGRKVPDQQLNGLATGTAVLERLLPLPGLSRRLEFLVVHQMEWSSPRFPIYRSEVTRSPSPWQCSPPRCSSRTNPWKKAAALVSRRRLSGEIRPPERCFSAIERHPDCRETTKSGFSVKPGITRQVGAGDSCRMRRRTAPNSSRGTATSAIWNTT